MDLAPWVLAPRGGARDLPRPPKAWLLPLLALGLSGCTEAPGTTPGPEQPFWADGELDEWFEVTPIVAAGDQDDDGGLKVL
ncbi:MAG: hypothetical protein ACR2QM_19375, partial [Longimicrobiales bacterium]